MNTITRAQVDVGRGTLMDIIHALEKSKVPDDAVLVEIGQDEKWVNGPSTSGNTVFTFLEFEWKKWVE